VPELLPIRYGRMMQSPFAFYRGRRHYGGRSRGLAVHRYSVQACGDCHLVNFGSFATPERRQIFAINDFDETLPAPWEWDIKRLAASFAVAGRINSFTRRESHEAAQTCVRSYASACGNSPRWGCLICGTSALTWRRCSKRSRTILPGTRQKTFGQGPRPQCAG